MRMKQVLLGGLLALYGTVSAAAQVSPTGEKIVLKKKFFSGYKYQQGHEKPRSVYGFSRLSFQPDFVSTLATNPPALAKAKQSFVFNGMSLLFSCGMVAIVTSDLLHTADAANGQGYNEAKVSLGPLLACVVGATVSGLLGSSKLKDGVKMYNQSGGTPGAPTPSIPYPARSRADEGRTTFGFKAGLNMAGQNLPAGKGVSRLALGAYAAIPVSENVAVQTEVLYSMKGAKKSVYGYGSSFTYSLNYLEFPVLAKYAFPTSGSIKPFLVAGPTLGILLSATGGYQENGEHIKGDIKPLYKGTDLGLVLGGGVNLTKSVTVETRYVIGLSNIASEMWYDSGVSPDFSIKNSSLSLMLGLGI